MVSERAKNHLQINPIPDTRNPLLYCWPGDPPNIQPTAIVLACPTEAEGKSLLLKTPSISDPEPRDSELELT